MSSIYEQKIQALEANLANLKGISAAKEAQVEANLRASIAYLRKIPLCADLAEIIDQQREHLSMRMAEFLADEEHSSNLQRKRAERIMREVYTVGLSKEDFVSLYFAAQAGDK